MSVTEEKDFEYLKLAELIQDGISNGIYHIGSKLPSVRTLRRNHNLSVSTVLRAFYELEKRGLIISKERYGYYVNGEIQKKVLLSKTKVCKYQAEVVNKAGLINSIIHNFNNKSLFPLSASLLSPGLVPRKKLDISYRKALLQNDFDISRYCFPPGYEPLREQIFLKHKELGLDINAEDILITNGCMEAVSLSLKVIAKPGDIIAIESPTYYGFLQLIESMGMYAIEIPTNTVSGIEVDKFREIIETNNIKACILISNFNNPLGTSTPSENKKKIVEIISEKNIHIIESDVYSDLYFGAHRPKPYKAFDNSDMVINCSSLSKTVAAGLRVGWMINGSLINKIRKLQFINSIAVPGITQVAAAFYLQDGNHERHLRSLRKNLQNRLYELKRMIFTYFPENIKISEPEGGFLLLMEIDKKVNAIDLYKECIKEGISILPGNIISPNDKFNNCIRLSFSYDDRQKYEEHLKKAAQIIYRLSK